MTKVKASYLIKILENSKSFPLNLRAKSHLYEWCKPFNIKDEAQRHHNFSHFSSF
jgi:hypothetical protein